MSPQVHVHVHDYFMACRPIPIIAFPRMNYMIIYMYVGVNCGSMLCIHR